MGASTFHPVKGRAHGKIKGLHMELIQGIEVRIGEQEVRRLVGYKGERACRLGIKTGPRLSPGYGKWELAEQRVLFALLPGERIGG